MKQDNSIVHPDFEAKAREILNWNISSGSEGELSALKSAISTALRDAYEGFISTEATTTEKLCDHLVTAEAAKLRYYSLNRAQMVDEEFEPTEIFLQLKAEADAIDAAE